MLAFPSGAVNAEPCPLDGRRVNSDGVDNVIRHSSAGRSDSSVRTPGHAVTLCAGTLSATVSGGDLLSVTSLRDRDVELLADPGDLPPGYRVHGARAGITLLHPWANRLSADRYAFAGREGRLEAGGDRVSRDAHGLAIHGLAAPTPWRPVQDGAHGAVASLTWLGEPGFPWAHQVVVHITLAPASLEIQTGVTALDRDAVPVALGWHPYFRRDPNAMIELPDLVELVGDARGLPTGESIQRPHSRSAAGARRLDYGVSGLRRGTTMALKNANRTVSVEFGPGYPVGQVFAPRDAPVVSFEPMAAPTDALVDGLGLAVAQPGRPWVAGFAVRVGK